MCIGKNYNNTFNRNPSKFYSELSRDVILLASKWNGHEGDLGLLIEKLQIMKIQCEAIHICSDTVTGEWEPDPETLKSKCIRNINNQLDRCCKVYLKQFGSDYNHNITHTTILSEIVHGGYNLKTIDDACSLLLKSYELKRVLDYENIQNGPKNKSIEYEINKISSFIKATTSYDSVTYSEWKEKIDEDCTFGHNRDLIHVPSSTTSSGEDNNGSL